MSEIRGEILTLSKMSGSVSTPKSLSGNVGAKTINVGGKGDDGATFIPSVSADGIISWTNDKDLPNPEPVNIKGAKGDKGDKGDRGEKGADGEDGTTFTPDETLSLENGVLSVNTAKEPDPDNTLPITSAAVAQTVGNIEILLQTI